MAEMIHGIQQKFIEKTPEEMFSIAFNLEQQKALLAMFSQGGSGGEGGGGTEPLIVHGTAVETEGDVAWQLDKTSAEIESNYKMGVPAVFKLDNVDEYICPQEITFDYDESLIANGFFFQSPVRAYGDPRTNQFVISFTEYALENNGELTFQYTSYNLTDLTVRKD